MRPCAAPRLPLPPDSFTHWFTGCLAIVLLPAILAQAGGPTGSSRHGDRIVVSSPDGRVVCRVSIDGGAVLWSVDCEDRTVIAPSQLGFITVDSGKIAGSADDAEVRIRPIHDATWRPLYGERSEIVDRYRPAEFGFEDADGIPWMLELRVYDEGVAFRYRFQASTDTPIAIATEATQFRFAEDYPCWAAYSAQGEYARVGIDALRPNCERPLTIELADDLYAAIGEAALVDFARMRLQPARGAEHPHTLQAHLGSPCRVSGDYVTPWRFVLLGETPGQLIERNYLLQNLNEPCAIADTSWIRPGKVIREVTLSTEGGKACVDFAVERGLQFVEFDAGWYGHEYDDASDATTVSVDPKRNPAPDPLDLHEVIRYASERGIGVLVYVNRRALERQLDEILPLYKRWGIRGVKYGFVQVGSQEWTTWLHDAIRKAAENRLMVDVHDEYRPTGFERTYPNLMTQEGIRGNETMPTPELNCTLPFTRMICGAGDYTPCWYCDRIKTTRAHQLATAVVFYSPWSFLHWYDRPSQYRGEPELDFWKAMPTVWDETRVPVGKIGEQIVVARRAGEEWFVGGLAAVEQRRLHLPLDFLGRGVAYRATIHTDASPDGDKPTAVAINERTVDCGSVLALDMAANGGFALRLVPIAARRDGGE